MVTCFLESLLLTALLIPLPLALIAIELLFHYGTRWSIIVIVIITSATIIVMIFIISAVIVVMIFLIRLIPPDKLDQLW